MPFTTTKPTVAINGKVTWKQIKTIITVVVPIVTVVAIAAGYAITTRGMCAKNETTVRANQTIAKTVAESTNKRLDRIDKKLDTLLMRE